MHGIGGLTSLGLEGKRETGWYFAYNVAFLDGGASSVEGMMDSGFLVAFEGAPHLTTHCCHDLFLSCFNFFFFFEGS